jgi:hypothetical protein
LTSKGKKLFQGKQPPGNDAVFVSYAWKGESGHIVDELEKAFSEHGIHILRDINEMEYKDSIKEFEQRIGRGKCVILVISDKYLRSEHCMFELMEIEENRELRKHIFPIVLGDANIYSPSGRLNYIHYWGEKVEKLNQEIKQLSILTNLGRMVAELEKVARIRANADLLIDQLSDMNALSPVTLADQGYSTLIKAVEADLRGGVTKHGFTYDVKPLDNDPIENKVKQATKSRKAK